MQTSALGVDVGGVIIDRINDKTDTSFFGDNFLQTTAVPGVFHALLEMSAAFGGKVFIVSKCGQTIEDKTRAWMNHHDFYARTGIDPDKVFFCRERSGKGPIAVELGLTHFVDDRLEVLGYLQTVEHRYLFQPRENEIAKHRQHLADVEVVDTWFDLNERIWKTFT